MLSYGQSSYSAQTTYFEMVLRPKCQLSKKKRRKQNTTHKVINKKQNKTKLKKKQTKRKQVTRVEFEDSKL